MVGIEFKPYEKDDVFKVRMREGDTLGMPVGNIPGPAWTLFDNGAVVACVGLHHEVGNIATLWAYGSDAIRGNGRTIVKFGKRWLDYAINDMRFQRIQAVVREDREEYCRFIEIFGFEKEGLMRKAAANGGNIWLYSRVED